MHTTQPHPLLTVRDWPESLGANPQGDLLVTTFHGTSKCEGPLSDLMRRHEGALDSGDRRVFAKYLDLEVDTFSHELARRVIEILVEADPRLRIRYLEFQAQRGILDMNRSNPEEATRKLWAPDNTVVTNELSVIHGQLMDEFHGACPQNAFSTALDVHTMYPFSPKLDQHDLQHGRQTVAEQRGCISNYIYDYLFAKERGGPKRGWNFINTNETTSFCNDNLHRELDQALKGLGIPTHVNWPYNYGGRALTGKGVMTAALNKGVTFDASKDFFVASTHASRVYLPEDLEMSRLEVIAQALARGFIQYKKSAV